MKVTVNEKHCGKSPMFNQSARFYLTFKAEYR